MPEDEVGTSSDGGSAAVVELRVATLRTPNHDESKIHWELMEDGELVNMGEWQIPRDRDEPGPKAWEDLVLHLAPKPAG